MAVLVEPKSPSSLETVDQVGSNSDDWPVSGLVANRFKSVAIDSTKDPPDKGSRWDCYLALVRPDARDQCYVALKDNPIAYDLFGWLYANVGVWSSGRFSVTYGGVCGPGDGRAFVQAHIEPDPFGLSVREVCTMRAYGVRFGGDVQKPLGAQVGSAGSTLSKPMSTVGSLVRIPFAAIIKHTAGKLTFTPRDDVHLAGLVKYFESAHIEGFEFNATIAGGAAASLFFCVSQRGAVVRNMEEHMAQPLCQVISGSDSGLGVGQFVLPDNHGFGREFKCGVLGNDDPAFHWLVDSSEPAVATVRGYINVRLSGNGVPNAIMFTSRK